MLKIASAKEIIPAKARYIQNPHCVKIASPNLTIPTGPDRLLTASAASPLEPENNLRHNCPSMANVKRV